MMCNDINILIDGLKRAEQLRLIQKVSVFADSVSINFNPSTPTKIKRQLAKYIKHTYTLDVIFLHDQQQLCVALRI